MTTITKLAHDISTEFGTANIIIENNEGRWLGIDMGDGDFDYLQDNGEYVPASYHDVLNDVMTTSEAAEEFGIAAITVIKNIERGNIHGRKSGGTWLIRRADAEARWGFEKRTDFIWNDIVEAAKNDRLYRCVLGEVSTLTPDVASEDALETVANKHGGIIQTEGGKVFFVLG